MSNFQHSTDEELLKAFYSDEDFAFEEIFNRYWYPLFCVAGPSPQHNSVRKY